MLLPSSPVATGPAVRSAADPSSCGTVTGAVGPGAAVVVVVVTGRVVSALIGSTTPKPYSASTDVRVRCATTSTLLRSGCADHTNAATPATIAVEGLVPVPMR